MILSMKLILDYVSFAQRINNKKAKPFYEVYSKPEQKLIKEFYIVS